MTVQPIGDRIAVKEIKGSETSAGGIHTGSDAQTLIEGEVVAVGTERYFGGTLAQLQVKKGDRVLFHHRSGLKYKTPEGEDLLLMREDQIEAVVNQ